MCFNRIIIKNNKFYYLLKKHTVNNHYLNQGSLNKKYGVHIENLDLKKTSFRPFDPVWKMIIFVFIIFD